MTFKVVSYTGAPIKFWGIRRMRVQAIIRYDGPALENHQMDINELAPALLALGDLIRDSNRILNGGETSVRVLVSADTEQQCFQLGFDVLQSLGDQIMNCLLYTSPSPRDQRGSRMPSSA